MTTNRALPDPEEVPTVPVWPTAARALGLRVPVPMPRLSAMNYRACCGSAAGTCVATAALRRALSLDEAGNAA